MEENLQKSKEIIEKLRQTADKMQNDFDQVSLIRNVFLQI